MRELSLFTGCGGGIYGSKLLGWTTVGYVEIDEYCKRVVRQRIKDGVFDLAPVHGDIREFIYEWAFRYQGIVDVITGGPPCQPFSSAGKRKGEEDNRNMWPQTIEVIRRVRPKYALLENVDKLLSNPYFETILKDITESRYDCRWEIISAAELGAPHRRRRLWILLTDSDCQREHACAFHAEVESASKPITNTNSELLRQQSRRCCRESGEDKGESKQYGQERPVAYSLRKLPYRTWQTGQTGRDEYTNRSWWEPEPELDRVAHGVSNRSKQLRALGNGQVPLCMAYAFRKLVGEQS